MNNLKTLRKAAGLTLRDLGLRLGVSGQAVAQWEAGETWPSAVLLPEIARVLGCSIGELFGETIHTENHNREDEI